MKLKTHQATAKRVTVTKRGKVLKRRAGQDHFNARETGKTGKAKRRDMTLAKTNYRHVQDLLPYSM